MKLLFVVRLRILLFLIEHAEKERVSPPTAATLNSIINFSYTSFFIDEDKKYYFPLLAEWGTYLSILAARAAARDTYMCGLEFESWTDAIQIADPVLQEHLPYWISCSNKIWNFFYTFSMNLNLNGPLWMWHKDRNVYVAFKHSEELLGQKIFLFDDFWFDDLAYLILFFIPCILSISFLKLNYCIRGQWMTFASRLDTQFLFQTYIAHNLKLFLFEIWPYTSGGSDVELGRFNHGWVGLSKDSMTGFSVLRRDLKYNPLYKYQIHLARNLEFPGFIHQYPFPIQLNELKGQRPGVGVLNPPAWHKLHLVILGFLHPIYIFGLVVYNWWIFLKDHLFPFSSAISSVFIYFVNWCKLFIFLFCFIMFLLLFIKNKVFFIKSDVKLKLNKHILIYIYDYSKINIHRWKTYFGYYAIKTEK